MPCSMHLPKAILMMPILLGACTPSPSHSRVEVAMAVVAPPLDDATARRLQVSSVLLASDSPDIDTEVRTAAARELMDLDRAEARAVLIEALRSKSIEPTKAVLDALRLGPTAHAELVEAVIEIMPATDPALRETIGGLLSRFSQRYPDVVNRVAKQALDQQRGPNDRLAAVVALGGFRHAPAPAAAELMTILRRSDTEPDVVVIAAMEQLSRLTGLPPSGNRMQWLAWWEDNRNRPAERWLEDMVEALTRQVASTQQELDSTREAELRMTARLLATYNEFWPLLPIDRQQAGLSALLQDDLGAVRAFGVDRLAILLRDGHASPEGQIAALTLLHDKDPTVRSKVAMILPELDPTLVSPAIPAALAREQDSAILNQLLGRAFVMQKRQRGDLSLWRGVPVTKQDGQSVDPKGPNRTKIILEQCRQPGLLPIDWKQRPEFVVGCEQSRRHSQLGLACRVEFLLCAGHLSRERFDHVLEPAFGWTVSVVFPPGKPLHAIAAWGQASQS